MGYATTAWLVVAAAIVMLMVVHIIMDVAGKYVFNAPVPGTLDLVANYYMVAVVFLPIAYCELRGRSIAVDLFYQWFPRPLKYLSRVFGAVASLAFFSMLAYQSSLDAVASFAKGEFVDGTFLVVIWPGRFLLPASFWLAVLVLVFRLFEEIRRPNGPFVDDLIGNGNENTSQGGVA